MIRFGMAGKLILVSILGCSTGHVEPASPTPAGSLLAYIDTIPGTLVAFEMIPLPGPPPLWIGKTEVTWEEYDVFAFRLDQPAADRANDATARPSRPYGAPDYGWGHQGYPAISIAAPAAADYAAWLSGKTGRRYRLATDTEWTRAGLAGLGTALDSAKLDSLAWHAGNSAARSHPVGQKQPDALGLHDMAGNAAEWVTGPDGQPVTRGGSWADPPARVGPTARAVPSPSWQERDPQFPKSRWWLSDGPFVGFRLVREP
jgi:formylglycine-generating enzyme required for sulfatase activity